MNWKGLEGRRHGIIPATVWRLMKTTENLRIDAAEIRNEHPTWHHRQGGR
jgi:hypothetical protein